MSGTHSTILGSAPTTSQLAGMVNQQFNQAYAQHQAQQALGVWQQNLAQQGQNPWQQHKPGPKQDWMVNGKAMTFEQFLNEICPDPDDPQRTYLTLKYKGIK